MLENKENESLKLKLTASEYNNLLIFGIFALISVVSYLKGLFPVLYFLIMYRRAIKQKDFNFITVGFKVTNGIMYVMIALETMFFFAITIEEPSSIGEIFFVLFVCYFFDGLFLFTLKKYYLSLCNHKDQFIHTQIN